MGGVEGVKYSRKVSSNISHNKLLFVLFTPLRIEIHEAHLRLNGNGKTRLALFVVVGNDDAYWTCTSRATLENLARLGACFGERREKKKRKHSRIFKEPSHYRGESSEQRLRYVGEWTACLSFDPGAATMQILCGSF